MTTSTVAISMACFRFLWLLILPGLAYAQSVQPSNTTIAASQMNQLRLTGGPLFQVKPPYNLLPLTAETGKGSSNPNSVAAISATGTLKHIDPQNLTNLTTGDVGYISCDPDGSNIDPASVFEKAETSKPQAIILYTLDAVQCNLTGPYTFTTIYSTTSAKDAQDILDTIALYPSSTDIQPTAMIATNTTASATTSATNDPTGNPAPTTAVAMSILYSITGIITLLFLIIIATGAVRAHRHPERYGPRNIAGRPRQSRAKGLARAMLETLPIVKFGDPEPVKPGSGDVELEDGTASHTAPTDTTAEGVVDGRRKSSGTETSPETSVALGMAAAEEGSTKEGTEAATTTPPKEGDLGCSICTEDFTTGEDVRVLPCAHKYHPACIDPWLLNVSGTCPLCRRDLRGDAEEPNSPEEAARASTDLPPPLNLEGTLEALHHHEAGESSEDGNNHQRHRISRFLDLNRLRHAAPHERIAALRQLREESRTQEQIEQAVEGQQSRRTRVTGRLRDTFRIRTRTQDSAP
ncbi:Receptor homology region,transmembrane domain- and RING domain-containing protein [Lachnellula hyalina]|uniref:RING-type E3 ubiquitin transferase n=1 Tax=Lachnellula hyalina TaxID=1316788 RepID=A0A8H8U2Y5_9HELO|nr:Receptor homology region,transmembrane domain- and RING domain-containing protein [Lachnellula hyalina]TVY29756.1 Receptor homology region,transmembrane domain- and RING domain-containing protein [Lachnellula hyalina]